MKKEWESKADYRNPKWKYTIAAATDVSKTIARVKREMEQLEKEQPQQVVQLKKMVK